MNTLPDSDTLHFIGLPLLAAFERACSLEAEIKHTQGPSLELACATAEVGRLLALLNRLHAGDAITLEDVRGGVL